MRFDLCGSVHQISCLSPPSDTYGEALVLSATGTLSGGAPPSKFDLNRALMAIAVLAALPIGVLYLTRMWFEGHYQFFPLFVGVVGYLFYDRFEEIANGTSPGNPLISFMLFVFSSLLILSAVLLVSAFLGAISLYVLFISVVYWLVGSRGCANSLPFFLLLLLAVPLPANFDNLIIVKLQFLASAFAGWILDMFGLVHFREGVILVTEQQQFFTEEACSGIRSLYSSIAGMAIYCVICRYGWARSAFTVAQTFFWVIFGNAVRIAIVVWVASSYTTAIADGAMHDVLGIAMFVVIMLLAISTDRLVSSMLPQKEKESELDESVIEAQPIVSGQRIWGRLSTRVYPPILVVLFLFVFVVGCRMTYIGFTQDKSMISLLDQRLPALVEDDLPVRIGEWERRTFEPIKRGHSSIFAQDSFAWLYQNEQGESVLLSVDCPWHEFHDLVVCYEVKGWRRENERVLEAAGAKYKTMDLTRYEGLGAHLNYAAVDRKGAVIPPPSAADTLDVPQRVLAGFRQFLGMDYSTQIESANFELPFTMVQVYCEPTKDDAGISQSAQEFFSMALKVVRQSHRFQPDDNQVE